MTPWHARLFLPVGLFAVMLCRGDCGATEGRPTDRSAAAARELRQPDAPSDRPGDQEGPEKVAKQADPDKPAGPRPDLEDLAYGDHDRLKLDLWRARSDKPTPLLVFFHGG